MASPAAVSAIVRSARPTFRSKSDKVAFAVHAFFMAAGYKLVALGDAAELSAARPDADEIPIDGWNASTEQYSFLYFPEQSGDPVLLVRALVAGEHLLVSVLSGTEGAEPATADVLMDRHVGTDVAGYGYTELQGLLDSMQRLLPQASAKPAAAATSRSSSQQQQQQQEQGRDPLRIGPVRGPGYGAGHGVFPPGVPVGVGGGDLEPPGFRVPPGGPFGPGVGGGMHVGPEDFYRGGGMRHPDIVPGHMGPTPPGLPPGARWDPIRPEGLEGWRPEDFQRGRGRGGGHPDIMPPGPGKGADWDNMFG